MKRFMIHQFGGCLLLLVAGNLLGEGQDWTHRVRIAGHGLRDGNAGSIVESAQKSYVFGIEVDNDITGRYESLLDPAQKLEQIKAAAVKAHAAGNRAFVYIAGTECITARADQSAHSFYKDHPDWVQRNLKGEPALFGGGSAFWVGAGDEDVWISPFAKDWRALFMERVRQIAATGIDGVYVDVPYWMTHFDHWEQTWASFDDYTVAAFKSKTGLDARRDLKLGDFSDSNFLRWVDFRIQALTEFMAEVRLNVQAVNPRCMTIAEIYPGLEESAVRVGSDVYELYSVIDVVAHEYSPPEASGPSTSWQPQDWFHYLAGMFTFRAFAGGKASWMLSYSWDGEKGMDPRECMKNLFAAQLTAGTNSWDARGHVMSGSNDLSTRTAVFRWISQQEERFYAPRLPLHPVGLYFSPATRNYFAEDFIQSYRGFMDLLLQSHQEFQVVTPRTLKDFKGPILILPEVKCLRAEERIQLEGYWKQGNALVLTGETGRFNWRREESPDGFWKTGTQPRILVEGECPGKTYENLMSRELNELAIRDEGKELAFAKYGREFLEKLIRLSSYRGVVEVVASPLVAAQICQVNQQPHLFLMNFQGLKARGSAVQKPAAGVRITLSAAQGRKVHWLPFLGTEAEISGEWRDGKINVTLPEFQKSAVVWLE
jgi:hypothetical protein